MNTGRAKLRRLDNVRDKLETARQGHRGLSSELTYLSYKKSFRTRGQATTVHTTVDSLPDPLRKPPTQIPQISRRTLAYGRLAGRVGKGEGTMSNQLFLSTDMLLSMGMLSFVYLIFFYNEAWIIGLFDFCHLSFTPFDFLNFCFRLFSFFDFQQLNYDLSDILQF